MDALVRFMTSSNLGGGGGSGAAAAAAVLPPSPRGSHRLPVSTGSAADARVALLERQLAAAEQQREAANQQLVLALQRADAMAADAARCAALQQRLADMEVRVCVATAGAPRLPRPTAWDGVSAADAMLNTSVCAVDL